MSDIQVYARARGKLHWLCPECHYIHDSIHINWRYPKLICGARWFPLTSCNKNYRLGLLFERAEDGQPHPPFNAWVMPPLTAWVTNRLERPVLAGMLPAIAHIKGTLDFRCPLCDNYNARRLDWAGTVQCIKCEMIWRVSVLFHPPALAAHRMHAPLDWSLTPENL